MGDFNFGDEDPDILRPDFVDAWRTLRPDEPGFTYDTKSAFPSSFLVFFFFLKLCLLSLQKKS